MLQLKISIVIPVINETRQVAAAIDHAWNCGADEVIVVDGGSDDDTQQIASKADCVLLVSPCSGRAVQMNLGAGHATGDVIVFLHADNWLGEHACSQIREAVSMGEVEFGAFRQRIDHPGAIYRWIETGNYWRTKWQGLIYGDQALFIKKSRFNEFGRFPEIALMEDFSFSKTLRQLGKPVILNGPTYVSSRRWQETGPMRGTVKNWFLAFAFRLGASPEWIARRYRRHDQ